MIKESLKTSLQNRIEVSRGHLKAIYKMIEKDKSYDEVLLQLYAVEKSIEKITKMVFESFFNEGEEIFAGADEKQKKNFLKLVKRYL